jgi:hypothetical protein
MRRIPLPDQRSSGGILRMNHLSEFFVEDVSPSNAQPLRTKAAPNALARHATLKTSASLNNRDNRWSHRIESLVSPHGYWAGDG